MAAAMISDRGLRKKLTQEASLPEKPPRKASKRKATPSTSKEKKPEQNNNQAKKPKTGDPKMDLFTSYQPWVIQTYGDLAKTKTITLKKYQRILRTLRNEENTGPDGAKFRFWVKAKGFHIGQPPGYDAKPADGIVCRYSVADANGCARNSDGTEIYTGSRNDPTLYIPTPPVKVFGNFPELNISDDSQDDPVDQQPSFEEEPPPPPPKQMKKPRKRRNSSHRPYVLNTPSPRASTPFGMGHSPFGVFTSTSTGFGISAGASTSFLSPPVGVATPLTGAASLADIYAVPPRRRKREGTPNTFSEENVFSENGNASEDEFEMFAKLIANQLRKLPLSLALDTQLKIQTLVNAARIQAVYQQYSYAGPSQDALSVTALSNNILSNIISRHAMPMSTDRHIRAHSVNVKAEIDDSETEDPPDIKEENMT